jgi:starvation-inducible outer membrane lipoprotein
MRVGLLLPTLSLLLGGCLTVPIPLPHMTERSPQVSGKVVDAATGAPVVDARVEFEENSALAGLTDEKGEFRIAATRKPEPFASTGGQLNIGAKIEPRLRVTREGYDPVLVEAWKTENLDSAYHGVGDRPPQVDGPLFLRPISLKRR